MRSRNIALLIMIIVLAAIALYIVVPNSPGVHISLGPIQIDRSFGIRQGLDLRGGVQVLLQADLPPGQQLEAGALDVAAKIVENRVNALGVVEPLVQTQGDRRIIVELPGVGDPDQAIAIIKETGLLEFIDAGDYFLPAGSVVQTTYPLLESQGATTHLIEPSSTPIATPEAPITGTQSLTTGLQIEPPSSVLTPTQQTTVLTSTQQTTPTPTPSAAEPTPTPGGPVISDRIFATVLTGAHLKTATVQRTQTGQFLIAFELTDEGGKIFEDFTGRNVGKYASIVLDKKVISSPVIKSKITGGKGVIEGNFTLEEAQQLVVQLKYGALPVPLVVETTRSVGPSLGQDSVQRSIRAGLVGLTIVLLFMLIYYRLPGLLADLALILYGLLNLAVYEVGWPILLLISLVMLVSYLFDRKDVWPLILGSILLLGTFALAVSGFTSVTLTLPAITGFILSTGMAVDANILVFERMKEELRAGRSLNSAIEAGFSRAWTSIRDSNISTLITCVILFYFGSSFGAGTVKGFAVTLALGVIINLFTAIIVTRTFMRLVFGWLGEKVESSRLVLGI
jgi:preprotein translocase subunit SecD